jgi:hypothetical protein
LFSQSLWTLVFHHYPIELVLSITYYFKFPFKIPQKFQEIIKKTYWDFSIYPSYSIKLYQKSLILQLAPLNLKLDLKIKK